MLKNLFKKSIIFSIVFGLVFIVLGLTFFFKYDPTEYDSQTIGEIVEIEEHEVYDTDEHRTEYIVYVDYDADRHLYKHAEYGSYDSSMKVGDKVAVYYKSTDPTQITGPGFEKAGYIGLAFAAVGLIEIGFSIFIKRRA